VPAPLLVLGGIVSVQIGGALAVRLIPTTGALGAVSLRLGLGALILVAIVRPAIRRLHRADLLAVGAFGLVLAVMNASFYAAIARLPLGVAVTVEFLGPLGLAAATSRRRRDLVGVALATAGVVLVNAHDFGHVATAGLLFALLAGAMWAAYVLASAQVGRRLPRLDGLVGAMLVSAVLVVPAGVVHAGAVLIEPRVLLVGLGVAVLSSVLPYSLELLALRRISPAVFGVLMSLEPAVAAVAGLVMLGQHLAVVQVAGMLCVVGASVLVTRSRRSAPLDV